MEQAINAGATGQSKFTWKMAISELCSCARVRYGLLCSPKRYTFFCILS